MCSRKVISSRKASSDMDISCFFALSIAAKLFENKGVRNRGRHARPVNPLYTEAKRFYLIGSRNTNIQGDSN
jgi:hypothetical protein